VKSANLVCTGFFLLATAPAFAAGPATSEVVQRDVNQQQRIEQGLQSGQLSTREAGKLETQEKRIDRVEAHDLKDGKLSPGETAQINHMENRSSAQIYKDRYNATQGNPESRSSERMQADVQRNVNQQQRIENGTRSGALSNREAGALERGQAHVDAREAHAARNGQVSAAEQARIQRSENRQSRRIYREKHD
jgi:hypothetical protein